MYSLKIGWYTASAEAGPAELRMRQRMSAAQARVSEPEGHSSPAPEFEAAICSLYRYSSSPITAESNSNLQTKLLSIESLQNA